MIDRMQLMLQATYPTMFDVPKGKSLKAWKEELDNWPTGWFPILEALFKRLDARTRRANCTPPKFVPNSQFSIAFENVADIVHAELISYANRLAAETCQVCGALGKRHPLFGTRCTLHKDLILVDGEWCSAKDICGEDDEPGDGTA